MTCPKATHAELARTVDNLAQWLSVVEAGLTHMLDKTSDDTIEEEQEDYILYEGMNGSGIDDRIAASPYPALVAVD